MCKKEYIHTLLLHWYLEFFIVIPTSFVHKKHPILFFQVPQQAITLGFEDYPNEQTMREWQQARKKHSL